VDSGGRENPDCNCGECSHCNTGESDGGMPYVPDIRDDLHARAPIAIANVCERVCGARGGRGVCVCVGGGGLQSVSGWLRNPDSNVRIDLQDSTEPGNW
jgi:hypothetical protein